MRVGASRLTEAASLLGDWRALAPRASNLTPFQSPAWIATWLQAAAGRCDVWVLRAEAGGEVIALGVVGVATRKGRLAETGEASLDDVYVEYNEPLIAVGAPGDVRRRLLQVALSELGVRSLTLRNVPPPLRQAALAAGREAGWVVRVVRENPCYGVRLQDPDARSRNTRQQIARAERLYAERGALTLDVAADPASRLSAFAKLTALHERVWQARGQDGALRGAQADFHRALLSRDDAAAEILVVRCGGAPIGALYNLIGRGEVMNYQSGFAFEADNRLKPGLLTHELAMRRYREAGFAVYDMMAGQARYKEQLGEALRRLSVLELERPSLRQKLKGVARTFRP